MSSYWEQERSQAVNVAAVDEFARLAGQITPRMRVRVAFGLQHALHDAVRCSNVAEVATLAACLRHLHALLGERG